MSLVYRFSVSGVIEMDMLYAHEVCRINELLNTGKICVNQARNMLNQLASDDVIATLYTDDAAFETFINYKRKPVYATDYESQMIYRICDDATIESVAGFLRNGYISYTDAIRWCEAYEISRVWLYDALSPKEVTTETKVAFNLKSILFKLVGVLNRIIDWVLEDFT